MMKQSTHALQWSKLAVALSTVGLFGTNLAMAEKTKLPCSCAQEFQTYTKDASGSTKGKKTPNTKRSVSNSPSVNVKSWSKAQAAANKTKFVLDRVDFDGNTLLKDTDLREIASKMMGKQITLADLNTLAADITKTYHKNGYTLASTRLPPQTINSGAVRMQIFEGILSDIRLANGSKLSKNRVAGYVKNFNPINEPLNNNDLVKSLILTKSLPGVADAKMAIRPGNKVGTSAGILFVSPEKKKLSGHIYLSNHGNEYTSIPQAHGHLIGNNLAGLGDQLNIETNVGIGGFNASGKVAWDAPVGNHGLRTGAAIRAGHYELGKEYKKLGAKGMNGGVSLYANLPLTRSQTNSSNLDATLETSYYIDKQEKISTKYKAEKQAHTLTIGYRNTTRDKSGLTKLHLNAIGGRLSLKDWQSKARDAKGDNIQGYFGTLKAYVTRHQRIANRVILNANFVGQLASRTLDGTQKMSLGGVSAVRAYKRGDANGDNGGMLNVNLNYSLNPFWQVGAGYDLGFVQTKHYSNAIQKRQGVAVYVNGQLNKVTVDAVVAKGLPSKSHKANNSNVRGWVNVGYNF